MSNEIGHDDKAEGFVPSEEKVRDAPQTGVTGGGSQSFEAHGQEVRGKARGALAKRKDARALVAQKDELVVEFRKKGKRGPIDVHVPTLAVGGFSVEYDPVSEVAWFTIRASVEFIDGITVNKSLGIAVANHRYLGREANTMNSKYRHLDPKDRIAALEQEIKDYRWSSTPGAEQAFIADLIKSVGEHWGKWFYFECVSPGYQGLKAITMFHLDLHPGKKRSNDHVGIKVFKVPDKAVTDIGVVMPEDSTKPAGPTNNVMELDSTAVKPRPDSLLRWEFDFKGHKPDSASLSAFADRFQSKSASPDPVRVFIGGRNAQEAEQRFSEVKKVLRQSGFDTKRLRFNFDNQKGDKGLFVVGSGKEQIVAVHEFGHMLGLGDTYAVTKGLSGTGSQPGQRTKHANLAAQQGFRECDPSAKPQGRGCIFENNEDVMAMGNLIRPVHSTPFLFGLRAVTGLDWEYWTSQAQEEEKKQKGKK